MKSVFQGFGLAAASLFSSGVTISPSFAAVNLLVNPGFEANGGSYTGWNTFGSGVQLSAASGDFIVHAGNEASKIYGEFTGCPIPSFHVGGYFQSFTPTAGRDCEFSGFSYVSAADPIPGTQTCQKNRCIAKIAFFNAAVGGTEISSNEIVIGDGNSILDQWVPFTVSAPVPTGALRVEALILFLQPACDPGAVYVDDLIFCEQIPSSNPNVLVNPSFSTALTGWTVFGNALHEARGNTLPQFAFARRTPPGSAKMFSTFVLGSDSGMYQGFAAAPGSQWELSAYALNSCAEDPIDGTSDSRATAKIVFFDGSFPPAEIGSAEAILVNNTTPKGTWKKTKVVATAPAGTFTVRAYFLFISPSLLPNDACFIDDASFRSAVITDAPAISTALNLELRQNAPNPFGATTRIDFVLPRAETVDLSIYDVAGRRVATLFDGSLAEGAHSVSWNGLLMSGARAAAGIYNYVLSTPSGQTSRTMLKVE